MSRIGVQIVLGIMCMIFASVIPWGGAKERIKLPPDTPEHELIRLHPAEVDPSLLPLDTIEELGKTGVPPSDLQVEKWELRVTGKGLERPRSLTYQELLEMPMVRRRVLLICPGFFADYAEWEGILLQEFLQKMGVVGAYETISFTALDGYTVRFSREEVENHFLLLAFRVNGEALPLEHGFPVRLVAEGMFGSKWIKWITTIAID